MTDYVTGKTYKVTKRGFTAANNSALGGVFTAVRRMPSGVVYLDGGIAGEQATLAAYFVGKHLRVVAVWRLPEKSKGWQLIEDAPITLELVKVGP